jgi:hypothetical protein
MMWFSEIVLAKEGRIRYDYSVFMSSLRKQKYGEEDRRTSWTKRRKEKRD